VKDSAQESAAFLKKKQQKISMTLEPDDILWNRFAMPRNVIVL
jgi:hypothetical protein